MSNERLLSLPKFWVPAGIGALLLIAAIVSRFAVLSNDSFPLLWQARHLSLTDPATFYNGFFPIGYPILLRIADITREPFITLEIVQVVLAPLYLVLLSTILRRFVRTDFALLGCIVIIAYPDLPRCILSATPDFFASLAVMTALCFFVRERYVLVGLALGIGMLFRTHVAALVVAVFVSVLILQKTGKASSVLKVAAGAVPFIILQGALQWWSGHGCFQSDQAFNVYRSMYGVDWNAPPVIAMSAWSVIIHDPLRFAGAYISNLAGGAAVLLPMGIALIFGRRQRYPLTFIMPVFAGLVYVLIVTAAYSPRALLPVYPLSIVSLILLLQSVCGNKINTRFLTGLSVVLMLSIIAMIIIASVRAKHRVGEYEEIAKRIDASRLSPSNVYTDDYAFYFPSLHCATPRTTGGWAVIGLPNYGEEALHLDWTDVDSLRHTLRSAGISTLILRKPPINVVLNALVKADSTIFPLQARFPTHDIYRVE